ncbi:ubiquinol-cytochrome C reductase hinge protein [Rhizoctonia solani AG-3 Rhs1AP]|uniref:Ubiquinol-cytochrome C reductase hinge protein n=1 Tax=Rhizoctonia solani AG-3 Rhs1AP TaxID=1086054 RepID=A0A0A1UKK5_9AGAM|nr:ubiquinol-cytochrome C reductase hinge protein [Rhizoctonia solani AG-3 Rhs1AP]
MTFWSSLFPTSHAEEENPPKEEQEQEQAQEEEPEEEEPEDILPELREECKQTAACSGLDKHFAHCTEKVTAGEGYKGEDCVEEFLMHCVDNCVAPKLFSKLR